jgi:hypothetical protein
VHYRRERVARRGQGGTTPTWGVRVLLTPLEAQYARTYPAVCLVVVSGIAVAEDEDGGVTATGWRPLASRSVGHRRWGSADPDRIHVLHPDHWQTGAADLGCRLRVLCYRIRTRSAADSRRLGFHPASHKNATTYTDLSHARLGAMHRLRIDIGNVRSAAEAFARRAPTARTLTSLIGVNFCERG